MARLTSGMLAPLRGVSDLASSILWSEALPPRSLENVGTAEIQVISVELK
jgi:hypothetical protein